MSTTRISRRIDAPPARVYRALLDPAFVARWRVPPGMTSVVHEFDAREGGSFCVSLTYDVPEQMGKSSAHTDTYRGHFLELVPDERVVEVLAFETADPAMAGEMRITTTLSEVDGATELVGIHEGLPPGVAPQDNEAGWRASLARLAELLEASEGAP